MSDRDSRLSFHELRNGTGVWWNSEGVFCLLPRLDDKQKEQLEVIISRAVRSGREDAIHQIRTALGIKQ